MEKDTKVAGCASDHADKVRACSGTGAKTNGIDHCPDCPLAKLFAKPKGRSLKKKGATPSDQGSTLLDTLLNRGSRRDAKTPNRAKRGKKT